MYDGISIRVPKLQQLMHVVIGIHPTMQPYTSSHVSCICLCTFFLTGTSIHLYGVSQIHNYTVQVHGIATFVKRMLLRIHAAVLNFYFYVAISGFYESSGKSSIIIIIQIRQRVQKQYEYGNQRKSISSQFYCMQTSMFVYIIIIIYYTGGLFSQYTTTPPHTPSCIATF